MPRRRILSIFKHLRFLFLVCIGITLGVVVGGIYYLNQSGLNNELRTKISIELKKRGVIADFDKLRFDPSRGLIAKGVRIYSDEEKQDLIANLEHLVIDVDKTKLMRGKVRVNSIALRNADISIPIDPDEPDSPRVVMKDLRGNIFLPNKKTIEVRELIGNVAGIQLTVDARIWSDHLHAPKQPKPLKDIRVARLKLIARIIQEIHEWHWPENSPPKLKLFLEGNVDNPDSNRLDFSLAADELERNGVLLKDVIVRGDYKNRLVSLDEVSLSDGAGKLSAWADYRPALKKGRFNATSTLHIQQLARKLFHKNILTQLTFSTPPAITCTGELSFDDTYKPDLMLIGQATFHDFTCLGTKFKHLKTDFSSHGKDTFLTGLTLIHQEGKLQGRILLKGETIRYEADSTLPASAYTPFIAAGSRIAKTLKNAKFNPKSKIHITANGTMNRNKLTEWSAHGEAQFENFTYHDTPLITLSGKYFMNGKVFSKFTDVRAHFDYSNYLLKRKYGGPTSAHVSADSISVDAKKHRVSLNNITGTAWPAPVVRLFTPHVADHIETYRFHRPPHLSASGTFDLRPGGSNTHFTINVSSPGTTNYDFLGETLTLHRLKAKVQILPRTVKTTNLTFQTFQGACWGNINVTPKSGAYNGNLQWKQLHLKDLGELYKFDNAEQGLITGGIQFTGKKDDIRQFNGKGSIGLERGNLFSVPLLGPLSPLVGMVLGKRNPTKETAKNASCTYAIHKGVVYSNDFLATTRSLKFTGEGSIDLKTNHIDLLVRMNARGVLGFFALPLRPFIGLFQFRGTGDLNHPKWRPVMFTRPSKGKKDPIFKKHSPKAHIVPE